MFGTKNSYVIDLDLPKYSNDFRDSIKNYIDQVKMLQEEFLLKFKTIATPAEIMGTVAVEACPSLRKRMESPCSIEKRNNNEWNAFRHVYKESFQGDTQKAKEAYEKILVSPDKDTKMKVIMDKFGIFKKAKFISDYKEKSTSDINKVKEMLQNIYNTHKIHAVLYAAYENPEFMKDSFKYCNSTLALNYDTQYCEKATSISLSLERFVLTRAALSKYKDAEATKRKELIDSSSEAPNPHTHSGPRKHSTGTQKTLNLKREIRELLKEELKKLTNLNRLTTFPWDQMMKREGFMNFRLEGWKYEKKKIDSMNLSELETIKQDMNNGVLCIVSANNP